MFAILLWVQDIMANTANNSTNVTLQVIVFVPTNNSVTR